MALAASIFNIIDLVVGLFVLINGIYIFVVSLSLYGFFFWPGFVMGVFHMLFGIFVIWAEVRPGDTMQTKFEFYFGWLGRGLFFLYCGLLFTGWSVFGSVTGAIICVVGVVFCVFHFMNSIPFPEPMSRGDGGQTGGYSETSANFESSFQNPSQEMKGGYQSSVVAPPAGSGYQAGGAPTGYENI